MMGFVVLIRVTPAVAFLVITVIDIIITWKTC